MIHCWTIFSGDESLNWNPYCVSPSDFFWKLMSACCPKYVIVLTSKNSVDVQIERGGSSDSFFDEKKYL